MSDSPWTIKKLLEWSHDYLKKANIADPRLESEILLAHALGLKRIDLYIKFDQQPGKEQLAAFKGYIIRRKGHEPSAYITGTKSFMSLDLKVTKDVLIPRPETEQLVEIAMDIAKNSNSLDILDIGTGSGAVAISAAKYIADARVHATDISIKAIDVAKENAEKFGLSGRITFEIADLFPSDPNRRFDLILSNPPYIRSKDLSSLQPEVARHEPTAALDGGDEGLDIYRRMIGPAKNYLKESGKLVLEIDPSQVDAIRKIASDSGYAGFNVRKDLNGHDRAVVLAV